MKILNLYAGIGGNRKLWGDEHEVTAVENNPEIAKIYQDFFPNDQIIVADAHQYLLDHYKEFDFIWSSPPCPTHSKINFSLERRNDKKKYPDMKLYQEIIFLKQWFKGLWVVENVIPYYKPLINGYESGRHYFWSNFNITNVSNNAPDLSRCKKEDLFKYYDIDLTDKKITNKRMLIRNCVNPKLGKHIFDSAFKTKQETLKKHKTPQKKFFPTPQTQKSI